MSPWGESQAAMEWHRGLLTTSMALSLASAVYLVGTSLQWPRRKRLAAQQIAALAVSDLALYIFGWLVPAMTYRKWLWSGFPPWCGAFMFCTRWLQMQSVLFSAAIPVGVLAALLRLPRVLSRLHWAPFLVVPLAGLLNIGYLVRPAWLIESAMLPYCVSDTFAERVFALELVSVLVFVAMVYWLAVRRMRTEMPASVVARSIRSSRRYMMAYFLSFAVYSGSLLREWIMGKDLDSSIYWVLSAVREVAFGLNGFLNFLAFATDRREALQRRRPLAAVVFDQQVSNHAISVVSEDFRNWEPWKMLGFDDDDEDDDDWGSVEFDDDAGLAGIRIVTSAGTDRELARSVQLGGTVGMPVDGGSHPDATVSGPSVLPGPANSEEMRPPQPTAGALPTAGADPPCGGLEA